MTGNGATLPNFIIIGAQRSGTTYLAAQIGAHPGVFMSRPKELHYFDHYYPKGLEWYRQQFAAVDGETAIGEATPKYMHMPSAVERMADALPDVRLVAILRNPVDRAYSHYWQQRDANRENLSFGEALRAEPERMARADEEDRPRYAYVDRGRYLGQLERFGEHYPREALHVVIYEELMAAPEAGYAALCRFLGVDPSFTPPGLHRRVGARHSVKSRQLQRVIGKLPRGRLRQAAEVRNRRSTAYPPMEPSIRGELLGRFEEDNAALSRWLGRPLQGWSR